MAFVVAAILVGLAVLMPNESGVRYVLAAGGTMVAIDGLLLLAYRGKAR